MSNLIEKQVAIDAVENYFKNYPTADRKKQLPSCSQVCDVLSEIPSAQQWIPVSERLPEDHAMVIGFTPCDGFMFVGFHVTNKYKGRDFSRWYLVTAMRSTQTMTKKVTHWMPLPEPPKGKEN